MRTSSISIAGAIVVKWKNLSKYWTLHRLSLGKCRGEEIIKAKEFLTQQISGGEEVGDRSIISLLWQLYQSESPEPLAEVCLRCVISHYIKIQCHDLAKQYGRKHNFTLEDLLPLVLDSTDSSLNRGNHNSLTVRILQTFNLEKSSLSAWTKRILISDKEIKRFLLEHGIEQVTNWLLLKQYNTRQLQRILKEFYHYEQSKIEQLSKLLESYQIVYLAEIQAARNQINQERKQQGLGKLKTPYPAPNHQQLSSMADNLSPIWKLSPDEVLQELQNLAQLIRDYKSSRARGVATQSLGKTESTLPAYHQDEEDEINQFLTAFEHQYNSCFLRAVREVIEDRVKFYRRKKNAKDQQFLKALYLYHCQVVSMGEIAPQIGLEKEYQVSRLLQQNEIRADVARKIVSYLISEIFQILSEKLSEQLSQEKQSELRTKLTPILHEKVNTEIHKAQKEDSVSKNRSMKNKVSQAVCEYLDTRK